MRCRALLASALLSLLSPAADAQELYWAQKMVEKPNINFGTVARGSECTYQLKIHNLYKETIYIRNLHTSCACASAKIKSEQIPSGGDVSIEVSMNTSNYMGKRDSNAIFTLSEPTKGLSIEVRVPLSVYIRTDVVFSPGSVNFGAVEHGAGGEKKLTIAYAGRNDWKILEVLSPKPYLSAKAVETSRPNNGTVGYDLIVTLKPDAPVGLLRDQLTLVTDDQNSPRVPLQVDGRVETDFTVSPDLIAFGEVLSGSEITKNVVVVGRKPFKISGIECTSPLECFKVQLPVEEKKVHVLPLKFVAPAEAMDINELFTITIPGRAEPVTFRATGKVVAPPEPK
jgi:hypothetical protein